MPDKPLRADARRNRARLLEVAEEVFSTEGAAASTEAIARRAGVGIGTVFRHFPTKEDLLEAVFVEHMHRLAASAETLADTGDPSTAFFEFFRAVVDGSVTKNALVGALEAVGLDARDAASSTRGELRGAVTTLLAGAQRVGAVRADVDTAEVFALLVGASRAVEHAARFDVVGERTVGLILDGLRPQK
ncbi:TetR/AcrR family transcriptional regulator [Antrihabitans cavernicola]|uniref:TetR/AcrR family transcriptional regulator n=1 Tax=Antrihabitans cavernicola TaxID=2495913 RepID=A0A5A7SG46_9NOCA|nr:TetR/AcrR family transcriptional regulator [Spelaeibacter cavernicola]KAA0023231.1 TetR/AcrR family transcriptional regulator [Spelaeibacter cavernicola]